MKKSFKYNKCLAFMCVFLALAIAASITALCFMGKGIEFFGFRLEILLAFAVAFFAVCYLVVLIVAAKVKKEGKAHVALSFEVVIAATVLIALSPIAFVLWIVESIADKIGEKRQKRQLEAQKS